MTMNKYRFTVDLADDLHEALRKAAWQHRKTKAAIVRDALARELDRLSTYGPLTDDEKQAYALAEHEV
jgi:uncharacterized protein YggE